MKLHKEAKLNDEQLKAVNHNSGPLLIVAGAGTGKTFVISEKIRKLIVQDAVKPEQIVALTFTEKAASQMEERADKILPLGYVNLWISTFHSFADQILREEIAHIGLPPGYKLLSGAETIIFLRDNLFLFNLKYFRPLGNPTKFLDALLTHFSRLKDENVTPEEYLKWAKQVSKNSDLTQEEQEKNLELAQAYDMYQKLKIKSGFFDFSDLVFYLIKLFKERKNILEKYRMQFKHVLVDEFQDTNIAQYELVKLLCPPKDNPNLTVVGDDSQAIYKFRGASVSNILSFMKDYPKAKQVTLNKNYRSTQSILDTSYALIKNNDPDTLEAQLGISKKLIAQKKGPAPAFYFAHRVEEEADFVAGEIAKLSEKFKYSDFAILVRANTHANPFIRALAQKGIPYQFLGPGQLFKQPEVKDLISYLIFLSNLEESVPFYRVLSMDIFEIDKRDLSLLLSFSKKTSMTLFGAVEVLLGATDIKISQPAHVVYKTYLPGISETTKEKLKKIYEMILRHLERIKKDTAGQILYYFLEDSGYLPLLASYKTVKEEKIALNISRFFDKLKKYEAEHEEASVFAVVDYIKMSMELGESPITQQDEVATYDAVNILTVHSSKGLEFPVTFLVNLSRGRFPTYERRETIPIPNELIKEILPEGDYHLLEERRLFYVALTRARDLVYLSASQFYTDGKRERKISPFVVETLGEKTVHQSLQEKIEEKEQLSIFDFKKVEEKIIKREENLPGFFSFSQIESYMTCPLRYKYQYVLKIPTLPGAAASFGSSIHNALQKFYQQFMTEKNISLEKLIEIYESLWIPLGYSSPAHEKRMKKEGVRMLTEYFNTFHNKNLEVIDLEKLFKIRVEGDIFVTGKIDRVDKSGGIMEIIDYKTGKKPGEKELKESLQLSIYLLAATDKSLYNHPIEKIKLTFYYLQDMDKITLQKTPEEVEKVKEKLKETVGDIRQSQFSPRVGPWCDYCPFRMICEAWQ